MDEKKDIAVLIAAALCEKIGDCDKCPFTHECYKDNPIEQIARKVIKDKENEKP